MRWKLHDEEGCPNSEHEIKGSATLLEQGDDVPDLEAYQHEGAEAVHNPYDGQPSLQLHY